MKNNDPRLYSSDERTLAGLQKKCQELTWPHLKKPTRMNYEYFFDKYLVPQLGKSLKPPVLLTFPAIKLIIEWLPEPTKTIVVLIVFASMRVGEALALRWNDILSDRIVIDERLYDDDLDDPKTLHGNREVSFDEQGIIKAAVARIWAKAKFRKADDFVFATRNGTPTERRNVLRHLKAAAKELKLGKTIDFRSFRTMHASLMRRTGARAEVARDNMGHSECPTTLEILFEDVVGRAGGCGIGRRRSRHEVR